MSLSSWMHPHKVKEFAEAEEVVEGVRQSMLRQGSVLRLIGIGFFGGRIAREGHPTQT